MIHGHLNLYPISTTLTDVTGERVMDRCRALGLVHVGRRRVGVDHQAQHLLAAGFGEVHDPSAINAIVFTMSVAFVWPAIAKPRRRRLRP